ncbi:Acetyl-CoA carboxylase [Bacillus cereus Rock3-29]|nr:Acetyl-CoA carboxylase [Bacillus thuringiensis MC28]EEL41353.1 Acetyl-CoA carboxylase [Bacillus cereus Rock3-29]
MGCSGEVHSLEVEAGDKVIPGMVLAYIQEDLFVSGSD